MKEARVLVVDDNVDLAENVVAILKEIEAFELDCLLAHSGELARSRCQELGQSLDLALLDLRLPDTDGLSLVREMRQHCPRMEIVIITGDATVESAIAAVSHGAFAYVVKPFRPQDLMHTVERALAKVALIRERETLRHELEQSELHHREVVEAVPALVLALDAGGRIVLWNRRLEEITGQSREAMVGRPGLDIVGSGGDRRLAAADGTQHLIRWQLAHVGARQSEMIYAIGIDVTDERAMLRRTLRAERLAAVGTLAAGLAHEVRNPLNSATLQLQVLRRRIEKGQATGESLLRVVAIVVDEIQRLERLVKDFLAFARPSPLDVQPASLDDLMGSVVEQVRPEVTEASVELVAKLDARTAAVEVDPERLRQVLLNLVRNALEAMGGSGTLTVRTRLETDDSAAIEIVDTGPGIPEDAPIFDAFYTTKEAGTGLGLAIVHRIVEEHGGSIGFESRPGRTCFTVHLPLVHGPMTLR